MKKIKISLDGTAILFDKERVPVWYRLTDKANGLLSSVTVKPGFFVAYPSQFVDALRAAVGGQEI